jgi:hypothetical protein
VILNQDALQFATAFCAIPFNLIAARRAFTENEKTLHNGDGSEWGTSSNTHRQKRNAIIVLPFFRCVPDEH